MRGTDATPEEKELFSTLHAQMMLKTRYSPPPPEEAHLYEQCFGDIDLPDGTTCLGHPCMVSNCGV